MPEETIFHIWDLTIESVDLYEKANNLFTYLEWLKKVDFPMKWEAIANIMLAIRHIEDAEYRILKAESHILTK
jgi:hypothetical protein